MRDSARKKTPPLFFLSCVYYNTCNYACLDLSDASLNCPISRVYFNKLFECLNFRVLNFFFRLKCRINMLTERYKNCFIFLMF